LAVAAFIFKGFIIDGLLFAPADPDFPTNRLLARFGAWQPLSDFTTINTTVAGQFNLHFRVAFAAALSLGTPYVLWEIWQFVRPALTPAERRGTRLFVLWVSLGFFAGLLFGYFLIVPLSLYFFLDYEASAHISNLIDIGNYCSHVIGISLGCAMVFQLPLLVWFLTRTGLVTPAFLGRYRRHAIVLLAILSAAITPPDLVSMFLVLVPLYGLYELGILISARTVKRRAARPSVK
jgi:sec-independent protein translocase protein TatC